MNFIKDIINIIFRIAGQLTGVIEMFVNFLENVERSYPGLVDIMAPLVEQGMKIIDAVIAGGKSEEEIKEVKAEQRERVVAETEVMVSGSPKAVSSQVIRGTLEALVASILYKRHKKDKYDTVEVRNHAVDILRKYGAGQGR